MDNHLNGTGQTNEEDLMEAEVVAENHDNVTNEIHNGNVAEKKCQTRLCTICGCVIQDDLSGVVPCYCGYYAHHDCLVILIERHEARKHQLRYKEPCCAICRTNIKVPHNNLELRILYMATYMYKRFCKFGFQVLKLLSTDIAFIIVGVDFLQKIYGHDGLNEIFLSKDSVKVLVLCNIIPLLFVVVHFIPWETNLLYALRWCSQLRVVGRFFPSPNPGVEEKEKKNLISGLVGGLLFPSVTVAVGNTLFHWVQSPLWRCLLGAATFLGVKGSILMYYKQLIYARCGFMAVRPYSER